MNNRPISEDEIAKTIESVRRNRRADGSINWSALAKDLGVASRTSAQSRVAVLARKGLLGFDPVLPSFVARRVSVEQQPVSPNQQPQVDPARPRPEAPGVVKSHYIMRASGESIRVTAIGDLHDQPDIPDKARFKWIARHVAASKPDRVVQIGDFGSFDSCSAHAQPGTIDFAARPSFKRDIESLEEACHAYRKIMPGGAIPHDITEGNHEYRVKRFENLHPELEEGFYSQLQQVWARWGWRSHEFGKFLFINGCAFTHVPLNRMGKPYRGKNPENTIANDAMFSIVWGDSHRAVFKPVSKIGPIMGVDLLNLGSAMPYGYVAKYAETTPTGWTYGICDLELRAGRIINHQFIDMRTLEDRYHD